jgi:hypothetical protein
VSVLASQTAPSGSLNRLDPRQEKADRAPAIVHLWLYSIISPLQTPNWLRMKRSHASICRPPLSIERHPGDMLMDGAVSTLQQKMWKGNGKKEKDLSLL